MLTLPPSVKINMAVEPCDMRKQFDGLAMLVSRCCAGGAQWASVRLLNKRATHVRIMFWDRNGYCMVSKRLERGTFRVPWDAQGTSRADARGGRSSRAGVDSGRDRVARGEAQSAVDSDGNSVVNNIVGGVRKIVALRDSVRVLGEGVTDTTTPPQEVQDLAGVRAML